MRATNTTEGVNCGLQVRVDTTQTFTNANIRPKQHALDNVYAEG